MKKAWIAGLIVVAFALAFSGCFGGGDNDSNTKPPVNEKPAVDMLKDFVMAAKPENAEDVAAVADDAHVGKHVVVAGKVSDILGGKAGFRLVDFALQDCNKPEECCETVWDYCCVPPDVYRDGSVLVEFTDKEGKPIKQAMAQYSGLYHLAKVVVTGELSGKQGAYTVKADGFYVTDKSPLDVAKIEAVKKKLGIN